MERWLSSLLAGIFCLIISIALIVMNGRITAGAVASFILFVIGAVSAMRLKP